MKRILFVCHGNICRSAMAEWIMKDKVRKLGQEDLWQIASAATSTEEIGNDLYPPAKRKLKEKGIPFGRHHARQVAKRDYDLYDQIIVMDENNLRNIRRILKEDKEHKIRKLLDKDVADPWYTGDFETTYQDLEKGIERIIAS